MKPRRHSWPFCWLYPLALLLALPCLPFSVAAATSSDGTNWVLTEDEMPKLVIHRPITTFTLVAAAESPRGDGAFTLPAKLNWLQAVLPILIPSIIAFLKFAFPLIPRPLIPFLCPFLGWLIDAVSKAAGMEGASAEWAAGLGALGIAVREMFDQSKKALGAGVNKLPLVAFGLFLITSPVEAQLVPLSTNQAAQVADALSPTWTSDQAVNEFRCITEFRTNRTARVISGQLVLGATVESVRVLCPTDITPDGKEFKFFLQHPRVYQRQTSSDGFRTWKTNLVIMPQPPPPPKPDFTGMSIEQIMAAMRAWNLASLQSGRSAVPDHTKSDTHFSRAGTRYVDVTP